jgi:mono/diheme cytochrome c family protein
MKKTTTLFGLGTLVLVFASCVNDPNSPGLEYMPDMYRSPAIEAYVDYGQEPYDFGEELAKKQRSTQSARLPISGSIAYAGTNEEDMYLSMPYPYENTTEHYDMAGVELKSPLALSKQNFDKGAVLFQKMCTHCHGKKGTGDGAISVNEKILGIPSFADKLKDLPEGQMFHTMTYGKGLMGSHASQLNKKERWQVIQFVQSLQTGTAPTFDANGNPVEVAAEPASQEESEVVSEEETTEADESTQPK